MKLYFTIHPLLQFIISDASLWAYNNKLNFTITETVTTLEDDISKKRKSSSHRQRRAVDVRSRGWGKENILKFEKYLEGKYGEFGALTKKTNKKNLVEHHDSGYGPHFHIQLHSKYRL